mgnify:CR=1 FL=1
MTVVVDASVALNWVIPQALTERSLLLWDRWQDAGERLVAPPLFAAEVTNVLRVYVRRGPLTPAEAADALDVLLATVAGEERASIYPRALDLSNHYALPSAYDAVYLALAESLACEMWTADRKFAVAVGRTGRVRLLTDDAAG